MNTNNVCVSLRVKRLMVKVKHCKYCQGIALLQQLTRPALIAKSANKALKNPFVNLHSVQ